MYVLGLTQQLIASVKATLDYIPDQQNTRIGIIAYNTNNIYFFEQNAMELAMITLADIQNPFSPLPIQKILLNVAEKKEQINLIFDKISAYFDNSTSKQTQYSCGSCGGAALKAAIDCLSTTVGKILWFLSDIPSIGYGAQKVKNLSQFIDADKESTLLNSEPNSVYVNLAEFCLKTKISVDIFACTQADIDLASLYPISSKTGGEVYYYFPFNSAE